MSYTQTQLDALDVAIAEGVLSVSYDGRTVTYRSLAEMKEIRGTIFESLEADAGRQTIRQIRPHATKGL